MILVVASGRKALSWDDGEEGGRHYVAFAGASLVYPPPLGHLSYFHIGGHIRACTLVRLCPQACPLGLRTDTDSSSSSSSSSRRSSTAVEVVVVVVVVVVVIGKHMVKRSEYITTLCCH